MAVNFEVRGSQKLAELGVRLKASGDGALKRRFLATIREGARETIPDIRQSARDNLPRRGGLNERVAAAPFGVRVALAPSGGRVSIVGRGQKELRDIDRGRLRHPVFGNRKRWVQQSVEPGFASKPAAARAPKIQLEIAIVMRHTAEEIGRGL